MKSDLIFLLTLIPGEFLLQLVNPGTCYCQYLVGRPFTAAFSAGCQSITYDPCHPRFNNITKWRVRQRFMKYGPCILYLPINSQTMQSMLIHSFLMSLQVPDIRHLQPKSNPRACMTNIPSFPVFPTSIPFIPFYLSSIFLSQDPKLHNTIIIP